jgi:hypothetical protein
LFVCYCLCLLFFTFIAINSKKKLKNIVDINEYRDNKDDDDDDDDDDDEWEDDDDGCSVLIVSFNYFLF